MKPVRHWQVFKLFYASVGHVDPARGKEEPLAGASAVKS